MAKKARRVFHVKAKNGTLRYKYSACCSEGFFDPAIVPGRLDWKCDFLTYSEEGEFYCRLYEEKLTGFSSDGKIDALSAFRCNKCAEEYPYPVYPEKKHWEEFAPLKEGELEELHDIAETVSSENLLRVALNRALNLLVRTTEERNESMKKNIAVLTESCNLHTQAMFWKTILREALNLLEDREWQVEEGPAQNYCMSCGASATAPELPKHRSNCKWVEVVSALRVLVEEGR